MRRRQRRLGRRGERRTLGQREQELETTLNSIAEAVIATDPEGRITRMNPVAEALTGWALAEARGQELLSVFRIVEDSGRVPESKVSRVLGAGRAGITEEATLINKSGAERPIAHSSAPIRDAAGNTLGVVTVFRDITEERRAKQMQERLHLAERMASVGTLAAGVAHEINNPLAYVIANIGFVVEGLKGARDAPERLRTEEATRALEEALEGAERVRRIVRDLKALSRPADDRRGPIDVERVLESTIHMAENEIRHRAQLVRDLMAVPPVLANESRLGQVFLNLIINAVQAIPEGAADRNQIRISTRVDDAGRVVIAVSDTGPGIPEEIMGRIFDPFFTSKPVGEGTGLGLAICHGIVTQLGGEIRVESASGRGSTFSVVLPAARPVEAPARATPVPPSSTRPGDVLVVDDEPLVGRSVQRTLGRHHRVTVLTSGREALRLIACGKRFDVILCDLMMPEMTGMDLYEALHDVAPEQAEQMIFLSGGAFSPRAREFVERCPNPSVEKPFDPRALLALIRQMIRRGA